MDTLTQSVEGNLSKDWTEALPVLRLWSKELAERADYHYRSARRFRNINRFLGGLNVALAALTATAMYAALNKKLENLDMLSQLLITCLAVLPAIASGLQKEWHTSARERGHLMIARDCLALRKELEFYFAFPPTNVRESVASWHERYVEVTCRPALVLP